MFSTYYYVDMASWTHYAVLVSILWVICFQDFLKYNESYLKQLPCQIFDPIPLGEGAGVGWLKDVDSLAVTEGTMLYELVKTGIEQTHAAVGVVVRLRKELSLVKDMPVLIAIDQVRNIFLVVKVMFIHSNHSFPRHGYAVF